MKSIYENMIEHLRDDKNHYASYNFDDTVFIPASSLVLDEDEENDDENTEEPVDEESLLEPLKRTILAFKAEDDEDDRAFAIYDLETATMPAISMESEGAEKYFDIEYIEDYPIAASFRMDYENYYEFIKFYADNLVFQIVDYSKFRKPFIYLNGFVLMKFNEEDHVRFVMAFQKEGVNN